MGVAAMTRMLLAKYVAGMPGADVAVRTHELGLRMCQCHSRMQRTAFLRTLNHLKSIHKACRSERWGAAPATAQWLDPLQVGPYA